MIKILIVCFIEASVFIGSDSVSRYNIASSNEVTYLRKML